VRLSSRKAACSSVAPQRSTGNPGSVYTNCETAIVRKDGVYAVFYQEKLHLAPSNTNKAIGKML
jgi:hypothetical protein